MAHVQQNTATNQHGQQDQQANTGIQNANTVCVLSKPILNCPHCGLSLVERASTRESEIAQLVAKAQRDGDQVLGKYLIWVRRDLQSGCFRFGRHGGDRYEAFDSAGELVHALLRVA
jgi:hypothetical protein